MATITSSLGYEQIYHERLRETRNMITFASLLDALDQGVCEDVTYRKVMNEAYEIARKANPNGVPTQVPDVSLVSSVIRSNVKIMVYNITEYTITHLFQAIYDTINNEKCGYAEVSEQLRTIWHRTQIRSGLQDPNSNNNTVEHISKKMLDDAIANTALRFDARRTITGGNLDGERILNLFKEHGVTLHHNRYLHRDDELRDIRDRRNALAHGSISFTDAGNQVTTSDLTELVNHVDLFLKQLRKETIVYLDAEEYRQSPARPDKIESIENRQ